MTAQEEHPFKYFIPCNSRLLIVGTFPPARSKWSYPFFYPNKQNLFWPVMARLAKRELVHFSGSAAVEERKQLLEMLNLAITDMGYSIERKDNSSLDENLIAIRYMDIFKLLDEHPSINKIIFTSSSGPVSASGWFLKYLKNNGVQHRFPKGLKPLRSEFQFRGRAIQLVVVYSPSRRAANRISFDKLVEMYANEITPV